MTEEEKFEQVCNKIESGMSLRKIFSSTDSPMSNTLFYRLIKENKELNERYARAKEIYADSIFDEIIEISDHSNEDHTPFTGGNVIQRDRLKVDARKWILSKLEPKKYGDKLDIDANVNQNIIKLLNVDPLSDASNDNRTSQDFGTQEAD
jgi:hypothetical protein